MTQNELFDRIKMSKQHLVEDTTEKNRWYCPEYPLLDMDVYIDISESMVRKLNFCPFCGEPIDRNYSIKEEDPNASPYTVTHYNPYYSNEFIPDMWYTYGYDSYDKAMEEYQNLRSAGFADEDLILYDNVYNVSFYKGEWA